MLDKISQKNIIYTKKGSFKVSVDRTGKTNPIFTNWTEGRYNAGTHGTTLLEQFLGESGRFPYPKSLYTVHDCIASALRDREKAIVCDFFGGSGTTLHATEYYNMQNNTAHQCILITNNELDYDTEVRLTKQSLAAGDKAWEAEGICKSVTWPRVKAATTGKRHDGARVPGSYIDGRSYADGFAENVQYVELKFLDPTDVALGEEFQAILPILWIMADAAGSPELSKGSTAWFIPKKNPFAVLIRERKFAEFQEALKDRNDITHVFLVTNSEESFREMTQLLPRRVKTRMLYKSYLDNFRLNTGKTG
jgi:adenine-specific DNA-methyltransferase